MVHIEKLSIVIFFVLVTLASAAHGKWFWESTQRKPRETWTAVKKIIFREKVRDLWVHGFSNYMLYAFPSDELRPLSCTGRGPNYTHPNDWVVNDVAGNFSVTLIDALDTFVIMKNRRGFAQAVHNVINAVPSFDLGTRPQVFETNIRVLGGLLSAHQFASDHKHPLHLPWYRGELLSLAHDLGTRLLPAFNTPTGIPYARVNLRHGVLPGETEETCTAGAGSLIIEFGVLSRLTGDHRFEKAAYKAFFAIWNRKSDIGLVGNTINVRTGLWLSDSTGIGAGVDSFYEYALKWYILSGETEFLDVWNEAYSKIMRYNRGPEGYLFRQVNMRTGDMTYASTDSLSSFWSGLQVLAGDVHNAIKSHLIYWNMWRRFSGIPEVFDLNTQLPSAWQYPLRPEFIESTYFLYRATRDTLYLDIGERVLADLGSRAKVHCGLASIASLLTNKLDDRMESFVLSETLKYLYLLFDEENPLHYDDSNMVFTTEGHLLRLPSEYLRPSPPARRKLRRAENLQCPAYVSPRFPGNSRDGDYGLATTVRSREDAEYARFMVGLDVTSQAAGDDSPFWLPSGWCELPHADLYSMDFVLSSDGGIVPEDPSPDVTKLYMVDDGYVITNMTGIRAFLTTRLDGRGYDITKLGPFAVRTGQKVYLKDTAFHVAAVSDVEQGLKRDVDVQLRFHLHAKDSSTLLGVGLEALEQDITVTAYTSMFGGDPTVGWQDDHSEHRAIRFSGLDPLLLLQPELGNRFGCEDYSSKLPQDCILLVERGDCTFMQKLQKAKAAGVAGVIVASDADYPINPTADMSEEDISHQELAEVALVVIPRSAAQVVNELLDLAHLHLPGIQLSVSVAHQGTSQKKTKEKRAPGTGYLYVNNRPLINVELLV